MKKISIVLGVCIFVTTVFSQPIVQRSISLEDAQKVATEVLSEAKKEKVNVSIVILDKGGNLVLAMKGDQAGIHTVPTAEKKAFTALTFGIATTEFATRVERVPNLTDIENVTTLGGGLPIKVGDEVIGSIGIGGAPSGLLDEKLGNKGLEKINLK